MKTTHYGRYPENLSINELSIVGCEIYRLIKRRGWMRSQQSLEICDSGCCGFKQRTTTIDTDATVTRSDIGHV